MTRDALLADAGRALRQVRPDDADALLQELEYALGRDSRAVVARTEAYPAQPGVSGMLPAMLAAVNEIEPRLAFGRRVTWRARLTPVADTTVVLLGVEAEPCGDRERAASLAAAFAASFAPELAAMRLAGPGPAARVPAAPPARAGAAPPASAEWMPPWFFARLGRLASGDLGALVLSHVISIIAPPFNLAAQAGLVPTLPAAPARFHVLPEVAPALRACFPDRGEALVDEIWAMLAAPVPRARAVRHDGGAPGETPRELALQLVELLDAVEAEQPEGLRASWSAAPAPGGGVELRAVPA